MLQLSCYLWDWGLLFARKNFLHNYNRKETSYILVASLPFLCLMLAILQRDTEKDYLSLVSKYLGLSVWLHHLTVGPGSLCRPSFPSPEEWRK